MSHPADPVVGAEGEPPPTPTPQQHEGQRTTPTPFLTKTYQLVDDTSIDDVISWNEDGSAFVVWRPAEFARDVLPKCFKHNNFSSFVRQLNTYGFRKIVPDRWEFANECFRRGEKRLLCDIQRRKISPTATAATAAAPTTGIGSSANSSDDQVFSSTSSPGSVQPTAVGWPASGSSGGVSDLAEENTRLRRENRQLSQELGEMKSLCNNVLQLMSKYSPCQQDGVAAGAVVECEVGTSARPPLELALGRSSTEQEEEEEAAEGRRGATKLFGVSIGFKRHRREDGRKASGSPPDVKIESSEGVTEP